MAGAAMGERGHLMRHLGTTAGGQERVSCASCGGTDTRVRYRKFGSQIVECTQCGLVFVNPRHRKEVIHQRYGPEYFHKEYLPAQGVFDGRVDLAAVTAHHAPMVALLEQRLGGKGSVFEVGAGAGLFLAAARQLGWRAEGVEISTEAVRFARDTLGVNVVERPAEDLPTDGAPYDAVVMFDVIEHLFDPIAVVGNLRRLLRPGGLVVISTPNFDALSRRVLGSAWAILSPNEHLYYFTERTLGRALAQNGFVAIEPVRGHAGWNAFNAMNARNTHKPGSWRAAAYGAAVKAWGPSLLGWVNRTGRNDMLLVTALEPPDENVEKR